MRSRWCALYFLMLAQCGARSELPQPKICGNGLLETGEECDDGNDVDTDGCTNRCTDGPCGNGKIDPGEECDLGDDNEDRPAILLTHDELRRPVMPVDRSEDVPTFYSYTSESAHTGFERADLSALYLFRDTRTGELDLVTHHGIDEDATGSTLPHGLVDMDIGPLPLGAFVILGDEDDELIMETPTRATGRWEFWRNTDGGVIGPLPFPGNWRIEITVTFRDGIAVWEFLDAGEPIALNANLVAVLTAFDTPSECRTDCTIPVCGDSIVDGGEVCDDGNARDGDGCAADCLSL